MSHTCIGSWLSQELFCDNTPVTQQKMTYINRILPVLSPSLSHLQQAPSRMWHGIDTHMHTCKSRERHLVLSHACSLPGRESFSEVRREGLLLYLCPTHLLTNVQGASWHEMQARGRRGDLREDKNIAYTPGRFTHVPLNILS